MLAKMYANMQAQMASFISRMDAQHERMMAWLRRTKPMDSEVNPEEM
jgi:hypothetical protein